MRLRSRTLDQIHSPIGEAFALGLEGGKDRPLLNMSQAAPNHPTAPQIVERIAAAAEEPDMGFYAPQPGLPPLRAAFARDLSKDYQAPISADQILITPGCNQAFCLVASALGGPGTEIILILPFYFNHDMWLRLDGTTVVHLRTGPDQMPDPEQAASLITDRTTAIVMVTPGNPSGAIVPPQLIAEFAAMAARSNIALIIDETYRSYREDPAPAHGLYQDPAWDDHVVTLHSFSKDFALPGYRAGALVGAPALLAECMKLLDCVTICTPRISQEAVLAGLTEATEWRAERARETRDKLDYFRQLMSDEPGGFELVSSGAYFGWLRHPVPDASTKAVVRKLVVDHDVLTIPGTAFLDKDRGMIRASFANLSFAELDELSVRLAEF